MPWMTVPIALAITGTGAAATTAYGQKSANTTNKRSQDYQREADLASAALEKQKADTSAKETADLLAEKKRQYDTAISTNQQRWNDYLRVNEPYWRGGNSVLSSLYDIAGMSGGAPAYQSPGATPPPSGGPSTGTAPTASPAMAPMSVAPRRRMAMVSEAPPLPKMDIAALMAMAQSLGGGGGMVNPTAGT